MGLREAAGAAAASALLGMTVGVAADVFSPVRRKIPQLTDWILSCWIVWIWLVIAFGICGADIRAGYFVSAVLGAVGWRKAASPFTRPVFQKIWEALGGFFRQIVVPYKYFLKKSKNFRKKLFATEKKWVTIGKDKMPK